MSGRAARRPAARPARASAALLWLLAPPAVSAQPPPVASEARAAAAYVLVDLRTGTTLAEQHPAITASHVRPGSIAKVATMSAGLAAGVLTETTRIACTRGVRLADGRDAPCAHAVLPAPLDAVTALAESCNVFFATLARRLPRQQLSAGLVRLGLDPLAPDDDVAAEAIGLGRGRAAPRRLVAGLRQALAQPLVAEGLARAADRGTASAFGEAGLAVFAKTGTAHMRSRRPLGIAVALSPRPAPTRGLVVLLPGGTGTEAARVGAAILAEPTSASAGPLRQGAPADGRTVRVAEPPPEGRATVQVLPLEDYVARVVTGESPADTPAAAREALAIAARTFALANRGRHGDDGYDLCTITHCQVTRPPDAGARAAARATRGRVLTASAAGVDPPAAQVFYSAACGGRLDAIGAIAPAAATGLPWQRARRDPAGVEEPAWTQELDARLVERALRESGWKGSALRGLGVEVDGDGRVRRVRIDGLEPSVVGFDGFRRALAQHLGWHVLKSAQFTLTRTARGYQLRGRGLGHGVGLCLFGASALARQGWTTDRLLAVYYEGLRVTPPAPSLSLLVPAESRGEEPGLRRLVLGFLAELSQTLAVAPPEALEIVMHPTVASYARVTGRPWWTVAATRVGPGTVRIDTLPPALLKRRGQLETTLRHELVHALVDGRMRDAPLWRREGLAILHSGARVTPLPGPCPSDPELAHARDRAGLSQAYRRALHCVQAERSQAR